MQTAKVSLGRGPWGGHSPGAGVSCSPHVASAQPEAGSSTGKVPALHRFFVMQISCDSGKEEEKAGAQECSCATTQPFPSRHPQGRGGAQEAQQELLVCPWLAPPPLPNSERFLPP